VEQKLAPEDVTAALKSLDSEDPAVREAATGKLGEKAGEYHAHLVLTRLESTSKEVCGRVKLILESHFKQADKEKFGARLPYGTEICDQAEDPCPACGMGERPVRVRRFLKFLMT
jgi:hypothetical protein